MVACPSCGADNPEGFRFCGACGSSLEEIPPAREQRKTVTIIFTDLSGSTAMGERLDPEALRQVMGRYFDRMKAEVERHGGFVEKFIGDAVMAVFGIPVTHEDDALRAVRAAVGMREALEELNEQWRRVHGLSLAVRTGINTGEVVAAESPDRQRLVTGDAVNVAARLEQAAAAGEILLGRPTLRLVRDAVEVEELTPLELKGKSDPVAAFRLVRLEADAPGIARRSDTSFVGRARELGLIADAYARAFEGRTCHVFTVLGTAGVGKSRLVAEALRGLVPRPLLLTGRCLPYGDGITFWPIAEIIRAGAGIGEQDTAAEARSKLTASVGSLDDADLMATRLQTLLGLDDAPGSLDETFWAVRRFLEEVASKQPLIVVIDDLQWAESPLLELVEHIADWSREVPMLLLCLARPEFLDERPGWGGGKMNATTILLEPLDAGASSHLVSSLLAGTNLDDDLIERIIDVAEGNPLFVEELLAMLVDDGVLERHTSGWKITRDLDDIELPSSIQLLLAARLERLPPPETAVLERAAVIGQVFYLGGVAALAPESLRPDVGTYLKALMRKDLLRPESGGFAGHESYRFRHILIRDAAYEAMSMQSRAEMHLGFANWLESMARDRVSEIEEILAHHLEQVIEYRRRLSLPADEQVVERAVQRLTEAAWKAFDRGDTTAATSFLQRAASLEPDTARSLNIRYDRVRILLFDTMEGVPEELDAIVETAQRTGTDIARWRAVFLREWVRANVDPTSFYPNASRASIEEGIRVMESLGDPSGLADAWEARALLEWINCHFDAAAEFFENALREARRAAAQWHVDRLSAGLATALASGSTPRAEMRGRMEELVRLHRPGFFRETGERLTAITVLSMEGKLDEARRLCDEGIERADAIGNSNLREVCTAQRASVERFAGDAAAVAVAARDWYEGRAAAGSVGEASTAAAILAEALAELGDIEEASSFARTAVETSEQRDFATRCVATRAFARIASKEGRHDEACSLALAAVSSCDGVQWPEEVGLTQLAASEVMQAAGRKTEAAHSASAALRCFERKGIEPLVARASRH